MLSNYFTYSWKHRISHDRQLLYRKNNTMIILDFLNTYVCVDRYYTYIYIFRWQVYFVVRTGFIIILNQTHFLVGRDFWDRVSVWNSPAYLITSAVYLSVLKLTESACLCLQSTAIKGVCHHNLDISYFTLREALRLNLGT